MPHLRPEPDARLPVEGRVRVVGISRGTCDGVIVRQGGTWLI